MPRIPLAFIANLALLATVAAPFSGAQTVNPGVNQWTPAAAMSAPRSQACSAIMQDGSLLVAGGASVSGPVNTAEIYGTGGIFAAIAPMNQARVGAACATLLDGRVLVIGGDDGTGALSTAEIYDPVKQTWTVTGSLVAAREGHQAVVNGWGGVWVAGGTNASGIVGTLEEFIPSTNKFQAAGTLQTPRNAFAMTPLPNGRVLIAGGTDGNSTLSSVEIYSKVLGTTSVAGSMAQVRQNFAASALPNGTVLMTGGLDANGNLLNSTEIFDPVAGVSAAGPNLLVARANHFAYSLPNNGAVMVTGGTGSAGVLASTETYAPWTSAIQQSASMSSRRQGNVSGVLLPGNLLVAGGKNETGPLSSSELFQYVTIGTDHPDYAPGTAVNISGTGWQPGEQVSVQIMAFPVDQHHVEFTGTGTADGSGNVTIPGFAVDKSHLGMKFILTATGSKSQAQTTFTDGATATITFAFTPASGTNVTPGTSVQVVVTVSGSSGTPTGVIVPCLNDNCNQNGVTTPVGATCAPVNGNTYSLNPVNGNGSCTFNINSIPAGTTKVGVQYLDLSSTYNSQNSPANDTNYVAQTATTTTMLAPLAPSVPFGSTTPYVAQVTTGGSAPTGQVQFLVNGTNSGSPVSFSSNPSADNYNFNFIPSPPLAAGATYTITANFLGDTVNQASTSGNSISATITGATTTTTENFSAASPIVYGQPETISGTVTATGGGAPAGTVSIAGAAGCSGLALTAGAYTCTVTSPGPTVAGSPYSFTATFTPTNSAQFQTSSSAAQTLTVTQANTSVAAPTVTASSGGNFTFQAQATAVAPSTAPVNTGTISFYSLAGSNQSTALCSVTGTALTLNVAVGATGIASSGSVALSAGSFTICAVYTGGGNFVAALVTSPGQNVTSGGVPVTDTVSAPTGGPANFGSPVTISATVTATAGVNPPTPGTLAFFDASNANAQIGATQNLVANGATTAIASVTVSNLSGGTHNVFATYTSTNQAFVSPTSSTNGSIVINAAPATFTVSSGPPNTILSGANVPVTTPATFIATYTGGLSPAPVGTVTFTNGGNTVCGPVALTAGVATCNSAIAGAGGLPLGAANVTLTFNDTDNNYTLGAVTTFGFTVVKASTTTALAISPNPATIGQTVTLTATVTVPGFPAITPLGTVAFTLGGTTPPTPNTCTNLTIPLVNAGGGNFTASCSFEFVGPSGQITYGAAYSGDATVTSASTAPTQSLTANKAPTTALLAATGGTTATSETVGQLITLTATVQGLVTGVTPTGSFTFTLGGNASASSTCGTAKPVNASGVATCQYEFSGPGLPATGIAYSAVYAGDPSYAGSTGNLTLTPIQAPATSTLTALPSPTALGTVVTLTATVAPNAPGNPIALAVPFSGSFTFSLNGTVMNSTCGSAIPVNGATGVAACTFEIYAAANTNYNYTATYSGDVNFLAANTAAATLVTTKANTGTPVLTLNPPSLVSGQSFSITAAIPGSGTPTPLATPTGTVTFTGNGVNVTVPVVNGTATVSTGASLAVLAAGNYNITATYNGDANYLTSSNSLPFTIAKDGTTITLVNLNNTTVITVAANAPGSGTPTGTITIYSGSSQNGSPIATGTLANGTYTTALNAGGYFVVYSGDQSFLGSTSGGTSTRQTPTTTVALTSNLNPVPANQPVILTATVIGTGSTSIPTGTVTFTDNGIVIGTTAVLGSQAVLTTTLPGGSNTIVATYSGDSVFSGSTATLGLTVGKPSSTITFSSSASTTTFGQSVTLTARITSSTQGGVAAPTGTVQFYDGSTLLGSATVVNGVATLTVASLPPGVNNIIVVYSGDANYGSFSGSVGSITVNKGQISINVTAVTSNGQETLTATVTASGGIPPTGTVTFTDTVTGQVVGTATLVGGVATITIPVTTDPIVAVYSGDGNFSTGTAPGVSAIAAVNGASYSVNYTADEIVTVFGAGLTTQTVSATLPLPTTLGGITVTVTDSAGTTRTATLFYVSPTQISFLLPAGTANGTATITVTTATGSATNTITVTSFAPGLFTANASGTGPLSAQVVSVTPTGTQNYTNTATLSGTTFVNAPIALTPAADTFYLLLYGTGFDEATVSTLTVTINGTTYTPTFVGPQGSYAGLDQINVLLPASLAGSGTVNVSITVNGTASNAGTIAFQ